jgi:hypothetical protein
VILHTGYNPDITLFLRQSRELGLRFQALIGHGAGYGVYTKLKEPVGNDVTISSTSIRFPSGSPIRRCWILICCR